MSSPYQSFRYSVDSFVSKIPLIGKALSKFIFRFKRGLKGLLLSNNLFTNFGFEYVKSLAQLFYRISNVSLVKAEGLDIWGNHPAEILEEAKRNIPAIVNTQSTP